MDASVKHESHGDIEDMLQSIVKVMETDSACMPDQSIASNT